MTSKTWQPWTETDQHYLDLESNFSSASLKQFLAPKRVDFWNVLVPALQQAEREPCEKPQPEPVVELASGHLQGRRIKQLGNTDQYIL